MSDLDDFKATYFDECSELLLELEEQFAAIEEGDRSSDRLNAVFRAIHSIKGGGGAFGFTALVGFAHAYETLLDHVRDGRIELSEHVATLCIRANDIVADFVAAAKDGVALDAGYGADEKAQFDALTSGNDPDMVGEPMEEFDIDFVPVMVTIAGAEDDAAEHGFSTLAGPADDSFAAAPMEPRRRSRWDIRFTPHRELYARANDPLLLFRELATLGEIKVRRQARRDSAAGRFRAVRRLLPLGDHPHLADRHRGADRRSVRIRRRQLRPDDCRGSPLRLRPRLRRTLAAELCRDSPVADQGERPGRRARVPTPPPMAKSLSFAELAAAMKPALKAAPPVDADAAQAKRPGAEDDEATAIAATEPRIAATACSRSASISTRSTASSTWWANW